MQELRENIEKIWHLSQNDESYNCSQEDKNNVRKIIDYLSNGSVRVAEKSSDAWQVNEWVKKAILLYFKFSSSLIYSDGIAKWYDKVPPKFAAEENDSNIVNSGFRPVPGSYIRHGAYIGKSSVVMPSFVNIGAYIDSGCMIDTWATVGSCVQVGKNCHISGGAGLGGVLEPLQASPVIIEDNCFIGARSEIVEGVRVGQGSVISMGVFIGASTKIVERSTGKISYGIIPPYSVVVPGSMPPVDPSLPSLYCAVIIKQVDEKTRRKTAINELLRT